MGVEYIFLSVLYVFLGVGAWSSVAYSGPGKETPFISLIGIIGWPILLIMYALLFLFTGRKIYEK